ncbi:MAG: response regulator [Lachnospiraceae bacterium]|nr:response regulator [Lachnospiraceae bacterium]
MVYRIAVLDDEAAELQNIKEMLLLYAKEHPEHELEIVCFTETTALMESVSYGQENWEDAFHILFMDINLPDGAEMESARCLRQKGFDDVIIFTSSSAEYALDAWAVEALHYLVKPVSQEGIGRVMKKAIEKLSHKYINITCFDKTMKR